MILILFIFAFIFSACPIFANPEPPISCMELSDGNMLIECGSNFYSIMKLQEHEYVVQVLDHSPSCPCGNDSTSKR